MQHSRNDQGGQYASNIPRYFVYIALKGFGFAPIGTLWVIYLQQERGLSLAQAALVDVTFFVTALLSEVPAGVVADRFGRKVSLAIGAALMALSMFGWVFAPTIPLIVLAYAALAVGYSFLSGADDALLYETLQCTGRTSEYQRLVGRAGATMVGAFALGSVASSLLASINLTVPFLVACIGLLGMLAVVLSFKEPAVAKPIGEQARTSFRAVLQQSVAVISKRPALRFPLLYLALIPVAAIILETLLVQPQALAFGVPLAALGIVVMVIQAASIAGSTWSNTITARIGEERILVAVPALIIASLVVLAVLHVLAALLLRDQGDHAFAAIAVHELVPGDRTAKPGFDCRSLRPANCLPRTRKRFRHRDAGAVLVTSSCYSTGRTSGCCVAATTGLGARLMESTAE